MISFRNNWTVIEFLSLPKLRYSIPLTQLQGANCHRKWSISHRATIDADLITWKRNLISCKSADVKHTRAMNTWPQIQHTMDHLTFNDAIQWFILFAFRSIALWRENE